jgi:hypothetical protein
VARKNNAVIAAAADGDEEIGLGSIGRGDAQRADGMALEIVLDEADQCEVRLRARRIEADQRCE